MSADQSAGSQPDRQPQLGTCDKKQYEHCGPHLQIFECYQSMPPFPCVNFTPVVAAPAEPPKDVFPCPNCFKPMVEVEREGNVRWYRCLECAGPLAYFKLCSAESPQVTRFADFDDDAHPFSVWWRKYGHMMMSGGGRRESIWAARGWIAREQLLCGVEVTGESTRESQGAPAESPAPPDSFRSCLEQLVKTVPSTYYGWAPETEDNLRPILARARQLLSDSAASPEPPKDNTQECKSLFLEIKSRNYNWLAWPVNDVQVALIVDAMEAWRGAAASTQPATTEPDWLTIATMICLNAEVKDEEGDVLPSKLAKYMKDTHELGVAFSSSGAGKEKEKL